MPYYKYNGTQREEPTDEEVEFIKARARLNAATAERCANAKNGLEIVLNTPFGGMSTQVAERVAKATKLMPIMKTRPELLKALGWTDPAFRSILRRHKLTRLYQAYMHLPLAEGQDVILVQPDGRRIKSRTVERFGKVADLISTTQLSRGEIVRAAGWRDESSFHRACQRHGQGALWEALTRKPNRPTQPGPDGRVPEPYRHVAERMETMAELLQDPRCGRDEALQRAGWTNEESFKRSTYRMNRPDVYRAWQDRFAPTLASQQGRRAG